MYYNVAYVRKYCKTLVSLRQIKTQTGKTISIPESETGNEGKKWI